MASGQRIASKKILDIMEELGEETHADPFLPKEKKKHHVVPKKIVEQGTKNVLEHAIKPGEVRNPAGRPPNKFSITAQLRNFLENNPEMIQQIITALVGRALTGDMEAVKEILNRIDGKVTEKIDMTGTLPFTIEFVPAQMLLNKPNVEIIDVTPRELEEGRIDQESIQENMAK